MNETRLIIVSSLILIVLALLGLRSNRKSSDVLQPVLFSHNLHVQEQDMDCTDCHTDVTKRARATLPTIEICIDCHAEPLTETETEVELLAYTYEEEEIPWQRIYRVPDHVYFSHRRHVTLGSVRCETCHGDVMNLAEPFTEPLVAITMEGCMECHEEHQVTNDCLSCHR